FVNVVELMHGSYFFLVTDLTNRFLDSFPTRRSSDLRRFSPRRSARRSSASSAPTSSRSSSPASATTSAASARPPVDPADGPRRRSEEHTSELQSRSDLVCRLLLEKKKKNKINDKKTQ